MKTTTLTSSSSSLHWCDKFRPEVQRLACTCRPATSAIMRHHHIGSGGGSNGAAKRRRVATVHVCVAAITLAFLGGVAVGITGGWLPARTLRTNDDVTVTSSSSLSAEAAAAVRDTSSLARRSDSEIVSDIVPRTWNVTSSSPGNDKKDGVGDDKTDVRLLRNLLLRRRMVIAAADNVDTSSAHLPAADNADILSAQLPAAKSWQQQQQQQQKVIGVSNSSKSSGEGLPKVGDWVEERSAVTHWMPQTTRTYPLDLTSRSHGGVPPSTSVVVSRQPAVPAAASHHDTAVAEQNRHVSHQAVNARKQDGGRVERQKTTTTSSAIVREPQQLVDGIYWSEQVEAMLPAGFSEQDVASWTAFSSNATVVKVVEGCGRMQNRMLVFDNGTRSCCRYRQNNDQIQGEIFSFHLARLLGLPNLPPASLGLLYGREWQWTSVRGQLTLAQWNEQKPVVMTQFVDDLDVAYIPRHFRGEDDGGERSRLRRLHPIADDLRGLTDHQLVELAQWSDLIVFDYVTANLDRVVNNMYNRQWNPDMMAAPAHNLARQTSSGLLVFLDNESGLLHGYRLLDKYESYHRAMLQSLCVFRGRTVRAIERLLQASAGSGSDVGARLRRTLHESQPYMTEWLPPLPDKSVKILRQRLEAVYKQVTACERRYGGNGGGSATVVERYDDSPVTPDAI